MSFLKILLVVACLVLFAYAANMAFLGEFDFGATINGWFL